ncbi:restriction endonuclease subunit S [Plesiomonas shigelloides]|uniref:Restriction modification system DNA specificity domain-containing protein n=1 Tax=Plesiomonas shigelloides 302-73 TaxID=1315976 RepID=R8AUB2_PLESH|nr:restriction endonuclease subunit S [Plesiomonas shigelloides]EON89900.1 restriction modification system DNA specificity domain-containing protein [Plesiomonas shigelloides 302-73]
MKLTLNKIPNNWVVTTIGNICDVQSGIGFPKQLQGRLEGEVPFFKVGDISNAVQSGSKYLWKANNYISRNEAKELKGKLFPPETIVFAKIGEAIKLNRRAILNQLSLVDNNVMGIKAYNGVDLNYLYYFMCFIRLDSLAKATTVPSIRKGQIEDIEVPLPGTITQISISNKIEELFSHIDAGMEGLKQAKAKLQKYRQSVLKDAVTGKLTEQWREQNADKLEPASLLLNRILDERRANWEAEQLKAFEEKGQLPKNDKWKEKYIEPENPETNDVPEIPREWGYLRLEALAAIQGGITVDAKRKYENTTSLPYLRVANVQRGYLDLSEIKDIQVPNDKLDSLLLENGDILFNEGGDRDKLGRGWVWRSEIDKCTYQNHVFRARLFSSDVVPEFVSIFGNTIGKEYFIKQGKQTTNLASINKTKLSAFPVPVCSKEEMLEIMEIVDSKIAKTDRMINEVDSQLVRASGLKSTILSKAFMGQLVDNTTSEETAEHLLEKILAEKALLEQKAKLVKKKPTARAKKMKRRPVLDVLIESKKALNVDELFELSGFQGEITPEKVEEFYQELKDVTAIKGVKVTPVKVGNVKQCDLFEYKEVKPNEA